MDVIDSKGRINAALKTTQVLNVMSLCLPIPPDAREGIIVQVWNTSKVTSTDP